MAIPALELQVLEFQLRKALKAASGIRSGQYDLKGLVTSLFPMEGGREYASLEAILARIEEKVHLSIPGNFRTSLAERVFPLGVTVESKRKHLELSHQLMTFLKAQAFDLTTFEGQMQSVVSNLTDFQLQFEKADVDHSGELSCQEFMQFLHEHGVNYPVEVLGAFCARFDVEGNGEINFEEFVEFLGLEPLHVTVVTPVSTFRLALDRQTTFGSFRDTIAKRMFWTQHNSGDLDNRIQNESLLLATDYGRRELPRALDKDEISKHLMPGQVILVIDQKRVVSQDTAITRFRVQQVFATRRRPPPLKNSLEFVDPIEVRMQKSMLAYVASEQSLLKTLESREKSHYSEPQAQNELAPDDLVLYSHHPKLEHWTKKDVSKWLRKHMKLPQYEPLFASYDGMKLANLADVDLKEKLGIKSALHRKKILAFLHGMANARELQLTRLKEIEEVEMETLTIEQVLDLPIEVMSKWLVQQTKLRDYFGNFVDGKIQGGNVFQLDNQWLLECGISNTRHRKSILKTLRQLRQRFFPSKPDESNLNNSPSNQLEPPSRQHLKDEPRVQETIPSGEITMSATSVEDDAQLFDLEGQGDECAPPEFECPSDDFHQEQADPQEESTRELSLGDDTSEEGAPPNFSDDELPPPSPESNSEVHPLPSEAKRMQIKHIPPSSSFDQMLRIVHEAFERLIQAYQCQHATSKLTPRECLAQAFDKCPEKQGSHELSRWEFESRLREIFGIEFEWKEFAAFYEFADINRDGKIQRQEFMTLYERLERALELDYSRLQRISIAIIDSFARSQKSAYEVFVLSDKARKTSLSIRQLHQVIATLGVEGVSPKELATHIHHITGQPVDEKAISIHLYGHWVREIFKTQLKWVEKELHNLSGAAERKKKKNDLSTIQGLQDRVCKGLKPPPSLSGTDKSGRTRAKMQTRIEQLSEQLLEANEMCSELQSFVDDGMPLLPAKKSLVAQYQKQCQQLRRSATRMPGTASKTQEDRMLQSFSAQLVSDIQAKVQDSTKLIDQLLMS